MDFMSQCNPVYIPTLKFMNFKTQCVCCRQISETLGLTHAKRLTVYVDGNLVHSHEHLGLTLAESLIVYADGNFCEHLDLTHAKSLTMYADDNSVSP